MSARRAGMTVGEIATLLDADAAAVARHLIPDGRLEGREWTASPRDRGGLGSGLRVNTDKAVWRHFSGPPTAAGDMLDLAGYMLNLDKAGAVQWARRWLGLDGADAGELERARRTAQKKSAAVQARRDEDRLRRQRGAEALWIGADAQIAGSPVDLYLRGRAIDLSRLARPPRALRFRPRCWNGERRGNLPALVARIDGPGVRATHRTWLEQRSDGRWVKADVATPKMALGAYGGGSIRLWRGVTPKPLKDCPPDDLVAISEGIEDGLSWAVAAPEWRVLAAVSLSNLGRVWLPPQLRAVTVIGQRDPEGSPAALATRRAIGMLNARGLTVRWALPPEGVKDVNELMTGA